MKINRFDLPKLKIIHLTLMWFWLWPSIRRNLHLPACSLSCHLNQFSISILCKEIANFCASRKCFLADGAWTQKRFEVERVEIIWWNSNKLLRSSGNLESEFFNRRSSIYSTNFVENRREKEVHLSLLIVYPSKGFAHSPPKQSLSLSLAITNPSPYLHRLATTSRDSRRRERDCELICIYVE